MRSELRLPDLESIRASAEGQRAVVARTPLLVCRGATRPDQQILLKAETFQPIGSFKLRGVFAAVSSMSEEERSAGLSTVSAGNTAQALAWCGRHFGVDACAIMPDGAPANKIEAVERFGGTPRLVPRDEVFRFLREDGWLDEPYAFVHPWIDPRVITGHGSMGLEIVDQCPHLDSLWVPVGGGGLLAGVASAVKALRPEVEVIAVEPTGCAALAASLEADRPTAVDCKTLCDGVAVPYLTEEMFPLLRELVDDVVLVEEAAVRRTIARLALEEGLVAEPSGVLALAAARAEPRDGVSVCVLSGRSIDRRLLVEVLAEE